MFTFYYARGTCSLASHIALEQAGADYEALRIDFSAQMQSFNSYLCSTVHVAHSHRMRGYRWADDPAAIEAMQRKVPQSVGECFHLIEREMLAVPWVLGEQYTVCDMYLFTLSQWLEADGVEIDRLPKVADHRRRMAEDPVVAKVLAVELQDS